MRMRPVVAALAIIAVLAGCTATEVAPGPSATESPTPDPLTVGPVHPIGEPSVIATGLAAPWAMLRLASGSALISERDSGVVKELTRSGALRDVGSIFGVVHTGEGGLLGLEFVHDKGEWLYAYFTTEVDNRIDKFPLFGGPGSHSLGDGVEILTGITKANNHNGGRIKIGPDGKLYATVGDATNRPNSQNLDSLNGKILRMNLDGSIPTDNPVEQWPTRDASPSGLAYVRDTFFLAALRGTRVWAIYPNSGVAPVAHFAETFGRIRDVAPGPEGTLWILTNNTDGRGTPGPDDDRIIQVQLSPGT